MTTTNPSWREAVRSRILGEELLQLPVKFEAFVQEQRMFRIFLLLLSISTMNLIACTSEGIAPSRDSIQTTETHVESPETTAPTNIPSQYERVVATHEAIRERDADTGKYMGWMIEEILLPTCINSLGSDGCLPHISVLQNGGPCGLYFDYRVDWKPGEELEGGPIYFVIIIDKDASGPPWTATGRGNDPETNRRITNQLLQDCWGKHGTGKESILGPGIVEKNLWPTVEPRIGTGKYITRELEDIGYSHTPAVFELKQDGPCGFGPGRSTFTTLDGLSLGLHEQIAWEPGQELEDRPIYFVFLTDNGGNVQRTFGYSSDQDIWALMVHGEIIDCLKEEFRKARE